MVRTTLLIISFHGIGLFSCTKRDPEVKCGETITEVNSFSRQFNFKPTSFWVFKNYNQNQIDTLKIIRSDGYIVDTIGPEPHNPPCPNYEERFFVIFQHNFSQSISDTIYYRAQTYMRRLIFGFRNILFEGNVGDSLGYINDNNKLTPTNSNKIENIHQLFAVNNDTFKNVYQMLYEPDFRGFHRIWWCPGVGILKFEYRKDSTQVLQEWGLIDRKVELY